MVRAVGIDPGTGSMDLLVFDDEGDRILFEQAVDRDKVTEDPGIILRILDDIVERFGVQAIAAPSGYGMPLKRVQEASVRDIAIAAFIHANDKAEQLKIHGLRRLMMLLRSSSLPAWFTPGVIHLPTVPEYRKYGRIDMGTADKVYSVASALYTSLKRHGEKEPTVVVVEAGLGYTAAIAVDSGVIVDGLGGTSGFPGFLGGGFMDSETAYAISAIEPVFGKKRLFQGGAGDVYGFKTPHELGKALEGRDARALEAVSMMAEAIAKDVLAVSASLSKKPERVYTSGRIFRDQIVGPVLKRRVEGILARLGFETVLESHEAVNLEVKEAALGSALIANGIVGGRYSWITDQLKLRESSGTALDYITPRELAEKAIRVFGSIEP